MWLELLKVVAGAVVHALIAALLSACFMLYNRGESEMIFPAIHQMDSGYAAGSPPSQERFLPLLERCIKAKDLVSGKHVHRLMVSLGLDSVAILAEHLIRLLSLSRCFLEVDLIFCKVAKPTVFTWHAIISAHVSSMRNERAFELYHKMQQDGINPNKFIYMCVLKASSNLGYLKCGRSLNDELIRGGLDLDVVLGNTLVDMYAKCGSLSDARKIFSSLSGRDVLSWGAMLGGYVEHEEGASAFELFWEMQCKGPKPNKVILLSMLRACAGSEFASQGQLIHDKILRDSLESDVVVSSALIDMYGKCGNIHEAFKVLAMSSGKCVVGWGALIGGLTQQEEYESAFGTFQRMLEEGLEPNEHVLSCLVTACGRSGDLCRGKFLHDQVIRCGVESDVILGNTLVGMYAECECLEMAQSVFDNLSVRSLVSWSTMICGYVKNELALHAVKLFEQMHEEGVKANMVIYSSILKACSLLGAREQGHLIYHLVLRNELEVDVVTGSTLIEMYAMCHSLDEAYRVFETLPHCNHVCWCVMIAGLAQHGYHVSASGLLRKMRQQGFRGNAKVFTSLLAACNQKGRAEEGHHYFKLMTEVHNIIPSTEHVHCLVDLLGRNGQLVKAEKLLNSIPITIDLSGWISLLSACRIHGNVSLGRCCYDQIISQDPHVGAVYTLMSCIYADAGMWEDYHEIVEAKRRKMFEDGLTECEFDLGGFMQGSSFQKMSCTGSSF